MQIEWRHRVSGRHHIQHFYHPSPFASEISEHHSNIQKHSNSDNYGTLMNLFFEYCREGRKGQTPQIEAECEYINSYCPQENSHDLGPILTM